MNREWRPGRNNRRLSVKEIHTFEKFGHHLVYDVQAMRLYQVNTLAAEILNRAENRTAPEIINELSVQFPPRKSGEILAQLMQLGLLGYGEPVTGAVETLNPEAKPTGLSKLVLYISQDCNLACRYCLTRGSGSIASQHMSETTAKAAVDLLFRESGENRQLTIGFYGGEPLLNFPCIKAVTTYAQQQGERQGKHLTFTMTTNGTLLTPPVVDFITQHDIRILLSIDGDREHHNANRVYADGSGSYDPMKKGLDLLKEKGAAVSMLTVAAVGDNGISDLTEQARVLLQMGAPVIQIAPPVSPHGRLGYRGEGVAEHDREAFGEDLVVERFTRGFEEMTGYFLAKGQLEGEHPVIDFTRTFKNLDRRTPVETNCNAGYGRISIDASGNILPCDNFIGKSAFYMGNVLDGMDTHHRETFKQARASQNETCAACWARHFCGGWCPYFSYAREGRTGQPPEPFCRINRHYFETALGVYSELKARSKRIDREQPEA